MKAEINGVKLEGTPQEIAEYVRLVAEKEVAKTLPPNTYEWWLERLRKTAGDSTKKPPHVIETYSSWDPNTWTTTDAKTLGVKFYRVY